VCVRQDTAMQSLGRDLTLSKDYELLQQFIPELKMLRKPGSYTRHELVGDDVVHADQKAQKSKSAVAPGSPLAEVVATFELSSEFLNDDDSENVAGIGNATLLAPCPMQPCPSHAGRTFCPSDSTPAQCSKPARSAPCPPCSRPHGRGSFGISILGGGATGEYEMTLAMTTESATVTGKGIPHPPTLTGPLFNVQSPVSLHAIIDKVRKRVFLRHVILKVIILPRQARDKQRENSKRDALSYREWLR